MAFFWHQICSDLPETRTLHKTKKRNPKLFLRTKKKPPFSNCPYYTFQSPLIGFFHFAQTYKAFQQGAAWLRDIAYILEPMTTQAPRGEQVAEQLRGSLDTMLHLPTWSRQPYIEFRLHLDKVSRSYWPGLFHCYDVPGLPRTNNELESRFRDTQRRLLRSTGQKGLTQRTLPRQGAWELLPRSPTEAQVLDAVCHTPPEDLAQERQRFAAHRQRFRMQSRSLRQTQAQFDQLRQKWSVLQATGTG